MIAYPLLEWLLLIRKDAYPMPPYHAARIIDALFRSIRWQNARWN